MNSIFRHACIIKSEEYFEEERRRKEDNKNTNH
jgi:hypothetical protein